MTSSLLEIGPEHWAFLALIAIWGLWLFGWLILQLGRVRLPALLFWLVPLALFLVGVGSASYNLGSIDAALHGRALSAYRARQAEFNELRHALAPLLIGLYTTALGLGISAPSIALANIIRPGANPRNTLHHASAALPALLFAPFASLAGWDAFLLTLTSGGAIALASIRIGRGKDGQRMAAGRGFVAALGVAAFFCLALAHALHHRLQTLKIWSNIPFQEQTSLIDQLGSPLRDVSILLGGASVFVLCGMTSMLPVGRRVVNARSSMGVIGSLLLVIPLGALVVFPLRPIALIVDASPNVERRVILEKAGIVLPLHGATRPWTPGTHVLVGKYWASVNDRRVLPYKAGQPAPDDNYEALNNQLREGVGDPLVLEADYRVNVRHLMPLLQHAWRLGYSEVCFVVQDQAGMMACQQAQMGRPEDAENQLLIQPDTLIYISEGEPKPIALDALSELTEPVALHLHDDLSGERLWSVLEQKLPDPILVLSP